MVVLAFLFVRLCCRKVNILLFVKEGKWSNPLKYANLSMCSYLI